MGVRQSVIVTLALLALSPARALSAPPATPLASSPSADSLLAYYPKAALADGVSGTAELLCSRQADGTFEDCTVESENPPGRGFGAAALAMAANAPPLDKGAIRQENEPVLLRFRASPAAIVPDLFHQPRGDIDIIYMPSPDEMAFFEPLAAAQRHVHGEAIINCVVATDGGMQDCLVARETPVGYGFADAAMAIAKKIRVTKLTSVGDATAGSTLNFPIRF